MPSQSPTHRLLTYAAAFEETYADDDWSRLDEFFSDDATYRVEGGPYACEISGRDALLAGIRRSIDGFDRRCDSRSIAVKEGPKESIEGDTGIVSIAWSASYRLSGAPDVTFEGRSTAHLRDGRIVLLVDEYEPSESERVERWIRDHAPELDIGYVEG